MRPRLAYQPGDSFLHRLHPLVKAGWLLLGTVLVFVLHSPWWVLLLLGLVLAAFAAGRLPLRGVRGLGLFAGTALFLGLLQVLFVREGRVLFQLGPFAPTAAGVEAGLYVAGRFLVVVLLSYLFVLTTEPAELAYALMRAGLPYRYGFALITALRLVTVFEQEGLTVYRAQLARGVRYDVRSPRRFLTLGRQFFLPLLVSALSKVDALAVSMEGRCFGKYPRRTFLRQVRFRQADGVALAILLLVVAATALGLYSF
ncbi:MAG: energy-coupling factor transporter transmembrane protein EcfT [Chloroflexia bacterium]|nr:energy-coupling factor transporter transmembrane protein EcfT [Chloroflexia bacterium]